MRTRSTSRLSLLFMSFALMFAIPAVALADTLTVSNTLVTNTDTSKAPGGTGTATVWLEPTNDDPTAPDDQNGCNVSSSAPGTVTLTSTNSAISFPNGNTAQLTDCSKVDKGIQLNTAQIAYKVADNAQAGQAVISAKVTGGKSGQINQYNVNDTLTVTITAPAKQNTAVSNVSGSGTYGGNADLTATLKSAAGTALSGKSVTFTLNGTSVGSATTDASGVATKSVSLSGIDAGSHTNYVSANFAGDASNNGSTGSGDLTVAKAAGSVSINNSPSDAVFGGSFTPDYTKAGDGTASTISNTPSVCSVDAGVVSFDAAGTCKLQASVAEGTNHLQANGAEQSFQIAKANAVIDVKGFNGVYDGTAKGASGSAKGVGNVDLSDRLNLGNSFTNVPGGTANWSFDGGTNYNDASGSVQIDIGKASSTTTVSCPGGPFTYTGSAQTPCTVSVAGAGGLDLSPNASYSDNTNAGTATASYSFAGGANHTGSSDSKTFTINKADAVIKVEGFDGTYDGQAHGASGSATGVDGANLNSLLDLGDSFTDVPGGTASWSFAGNANHEAARGSVAIKIAKANTATTVTCQAGPFTYTGSAIEPCSASVSGPGLNNQPLGVTYTNNVNAGQATASASYAGNGNLNASSDSKPFAIGKVQLSVDAKNQSTVYGDSHLAPSYELSGFVNSENRTTANVTGDANCLIGSAGPGVGVYNDAITCAPGDLAARNYSFAVGTKGTLTITARPITVTAVADSKIYGDPDQALDFRVGPSGLAPGDTLGSVFSGNLTRVAGENVGSYAIRQGTLAANSNYDVKSYTGADFTITARATTVTADSHTKQIGAADPALTYRATNLAPGDTLGGVFSGSLIRDPGEGIGTYAIKKGTLAANGNYSLNAFTPGTLKIVYGTAFGGIQQPINADGSSRVKLGSTVPVKFTLSSNGSPLNSAVAYLNVKKLDNSPDMGVDEAPLTIAPSSGNQFRLGDATAGQYIYNLSTKNAFTGANGSSITTWTQGTYQLQIVLDDGTARTVTIQIVK